MHTHACTHAWFSCHSAQRQSHTCTNSPAYTAPLFTKLCHGPSCTLRWLTADSRQHMRACMPACCAVPRSLRPKTPAEIHKVVWHQDAGLTSTGAPNLQTVEERTASFGMASIINVWSPLVDATASNGAMKFVPGSHKLGCLPHIILET